jgi:outer membrane protein assembly factor BamB
MKRILLALIVLAVLLIGGAAAFWHWKTGEVKTKRGTTTVQFKPKEKPGAIKRPKKVVREFPWVTYGYDDARTHYGAPFRLRPPYRRLWMVRAGFYIEFPPAVAYGKVYVPQLKGRFIAIDGDTGKIAWQKRFHNCTAASPAVWRGVVYEPYLPLPCSYGDRNATGFIVAMNAKTGRVLWHRRTAPSESSPLIVNGVLYFGAWDGKVYALDLKTRKLLWSAQTDAEIDSSAAYHAGRIFVGTNGGHIYALNARSGQILWRASSYSHFPNGREYFYATPAVAYGRVFAGNTDGTLYSYGEKTGDLLWAQRAGTYVYSAPAVWHGTVYAGSYDGSMYAFNVGTGDLRWKYDAPSSIHGAPTIMDGLIYFSTCGTCGHNGSRYAKQGDRGTFALDALSGRLVWSFPDGRYSPMVADESHAYLVGNTRVYGLSPCAQRTASLAKRRLLRAC